MSQVIPRIIQGSIPDHAKWIHTTSHKYWKPLEKKKHKAISEKVDDHQQLAKKQHLLNVVCFNPFTMRKWGFLPFKKLWQKRWKKNSMFWRPTCWVFLHFFRRSFTLANMFDHIILPSEMGMPNGMIHAVDGWNPANQLRLVVYPIIYKVYTFQAVQGFFRQTVLVYIRAFY